MREAKLAIDLEVFAVAAIDIFKLEIGAINCDLQAIMAMT